MVFGWLWFGRVSDVMGFRFRAGGQINSGGNQAEVFFSCAFLNWVFSVAE
jgi:hypothetical protein